LGYLLSALRRGDAVADANAANAEGQGRDSAGGERGRGPGQLQTFLKDHGVNLLPVRKGDQKSNALYGTFKFPETYIIDRNGIVRRNFIGAIDWTAPDVLEYLGKL
jgi:hypothetical protein